MNKFSKIALSTLLSTTLLSASVARAITMTFSNGDVVDIGDSYTLNGVQYSTITDYFNALNKVVSYLSSSSNLVNNAMKDLSRVDYTFNQLSQQVQPLLQQKSQGNLSSEQEVQLHILLKQEALYLAPMPETQEAIREIVKFVKTYQNSSDPMLRYYVNSLKTYLPSELESWSIDPLTVTSVKQLPSLQAPTLSTNHMLTASNSAFGVVDNRLTNFVGTSVAAGDGGMFTKKGVWAKAMITTAKQKTYGMIEGYNLRQPGGTIGIDAGNDDFLVGAAYSYLYGKTTGKVFGAKDTTRTNLGTLYGMYNFANNIFVSAQAQYGKSTIKKSRPWGDTSGTIARAKTKGTIIAGKLESGYDYAMPFDTNWHLVPTIGISTSAFNVKGYTEDQGTGPSYGKRKVTRTAGLVGLMTKYNLQGTNKFTIIPELHVNMSHAFKTKNKDTIITLVDGVDPLVTPSGKLSKHFYQIGTSLKIVKCSTIEAGLGYDLGLSKKFQSHTGQLNFRYNF